MFSIYSVSEMPCSANIGTKHAFLQFVRLDNTKGAIRGAVLVSFSLTVSPLLTHRVIYPTNCKLVAT